MTTIEIDLKHAHERLARFRQQIDWQEDGMAWLDAHLPNCPFEPYYIHVATDGSIDVYFSKGEGAEERAATIRQFLGVQQSDKHHTCFSKDSVQLITKAPCDSCVINFIVEGAALPETCQIIEVPETLYKMVCNT